MAGAILLRRFRKTRCSFSRRSTSDVSIVILRGRRSTWDLSCRVFSQIALSGLVQGCVTTGDKVQIPWQAWHFVRCDENWRKPRTKHRFWGKTRIGKHRFWSYKVWKLDEVLHEMLVLMLPRVSSRVSGFPVASPCLWGKLQNLSFSKVSKQVVMSFCVASTALCDIPTCWYNVSKVVLCGKRNTFVRGLHNPSCSFRGSRSILEISVVILRGRRSTSDVSHCVLYTPHSTLHHLHFTLHTVHWIPHFTLYTSHSTLYTPYFELYTPHSTL